MKNEDSRLGRRLGNAKSSAVAIGSNSPTSIAKPKSLKDVNPDVRFSYVLSDSNSIDPSKRIPRELLMDYSNNSLVVVDGNGDTLSLLEYIADSLKDKLGPMHMVLPAQHTNATSQQDGFMSQRDKVMLDAVAEEVAKIKGLITGSIDRDVFSVQSLEYEIKNGDIMIRNCYISNGKFGYTIDGTGYSLESRPKHNFINAYGHQGYRDTFIGFEVIRHNASYNRLVMFDDCIIREEEIVVGGHVMKYDGTRHVYKDTQSDRIIIPLLKIRRRNDSLISASNIYGKLTEASLSYGEITDIGRKNLPDDTLQNILIDRMESISNKVNFDNGIVKILSTNKEFNIDLDRDFVYIPMDGNDACSITGAALNKGCSYINSPYGEMMRRANRAGNTIPIPSNDSITLNFLIRKDIDGISDQDIISFKDSFMRPLIAIKYKTKNELEIDIMDENGSKNTVGCKLSDLRYDDINVKMDQYNNLSVFVNNELAITANMIIDISLAYNMSVDTLSLPIGNILLTKNMLHMNEDIGENVQLLEKFTTMSDSIKTRNKTFMFKYGDEIPDADINTEFVLKQNGTIQNGDKLMIYFDNDIVDSYVDGSKIEFISGNKIIISDKEKYNIGDRIKIINTESNDNLDNVYTIIEKTETELVLNQIIPTKFIGYEVFDITKSRLVRVSINDVEQPVSVNNHSATVYIAGDYPIDTIFTVKIIEKLESSKIRNTINDVHTVKFMDLFTEKESSNSIAKIGLHNSQIRLNGDIINGNTSNGLLITAAAGETEINLEVRINVYDYIKSFDMKSFREVIDINGSVLISSGEDELYLNGNELTGRSKSNAIVPLGIKVEDFIIRDNQLILYIKVKKAIEGESAPYLYMNKLDLDLRFKDDVSAFALRDSQSNKMTSYLLLNGIGLYTNSTSPIDIIIDEKFDSYSVYDGYKSEDFITEEIRGYRLIKDANNLVKVLQVDGNKLYSLDKKYIL